MLSESSDEELELPEDVTLLTLSTTSFTASESASSVLIPHS